MDLPTLVMNTGELLGADSPYVNAVDRYFHQQAQIRNDGRRRDWEGLWFTLLILPEPVYVFFGVRSGRGMLVAAVIITEFPDGTVGVLHCAEHEGARKVWEFES